MIPSFPQFKKLALEDRAAIYQFTSLYPPYSDFNFTSLWSYNTKNTVLISQLNKNLVVRFTDYVTTRPFYSFLGSHSIPDTVQKLLALSKKEQIGNQLQLIPEHTIKSAPSLIVNVHIREDRDNFDYVYPLSDWTKLQGRRFEHKRWRFHQFCKTQPQHTAKLIDITQKNVCSQLIHLFTIWEQKKHKKEEETHNELTALKRLLQDASAFNLICVGIFNSRSLVAFSLNETVQLSYAIGHFAKTDPSIKGIAEALHVYSAQHLLQAGCTYFNLEQDLGIEGLRVDKMSWRPVSYLKKYSLISPNP